jgi:hypothetical protein
MTALGTIQDTAAAAATHINERKDITMHKLPLIGPMLFLKFGILVAIIASLTVVKPMAIAAHKGTQKICSFVMPADECARHC